MNKGIELLYVAKNGRELNANECLEINKALAVIKVDDIPEEQLGNVKDYLITALNMNSVEQSLIKPLDNLLGFMQ
ncbi:hypothetical protein [Marinomonas sp. IMCC 4694]|uniref:hypothetical protein n=1 Tax=Marinomonas sp. IMCC 4694 TaxID=2605432 RepID=UPI0011E724F8|nr:hypothetical protein [Marinomonas sp. IMCC 4694]TYL48561.1 hypothetical protein FXV75_11785 [Marinomonas sp. IMCC 4694]